MQKNRVGELTAQIEEAETLTDEQQSLLEQKDFQIEAQIAKIENQETEISNLHAQHETMTKKQTKLAALVVESSELVRKTEQKMQE